MPKSKAPTKVQSSQVSKDSQGIVESAIQGLVATSKEEQQILLRANEKIAAQQVEALMPLINGTVRAALVTQGLAEALAGDDHQELLGSEEGQDFLDGFIIECEETRAELEVGRQNAIALLSEWQSDTNSRSQSATLRLAEGREETKALSSSDEWSNAVDVDIDEEGEI